mgnify:CR=1 FL=1
MSMMTAMYQAMNDAMDEANVEHGAQYDDGLTVQDEPFDLASETGADTFNLFLPNDGTPAIERRLRKQGLRKAEDSQRDNVWDGYIELWSNGRAHRVHVLRQPSGDKVL